MIVQGIIGCLAMLIILKLNNLAWSANFKSQEKKIIRIVVIRAYAWYGEPSYDIRSLIIKKLKGRGFKLVGEDSSEYDATLRIAYSEIKGEEFRTYKRMYKGKKEYIGISYAPWICFKFALYRKDGTLAFKEEIEFSGIPGPRTIFDVIRLDGRRLEYYIYGSLYEASIEAFEKACEGNFVFRYLPELIHASLGDTEALCNIIKQNYWENWREGKKVIKVLTQIKQPSVLEAVKKMWRGRLMYIEFEPFLFFITHPSLYKELSHKGISCKKIEKMGGLYFRFGRIYYDRKNLEREYTKRKWGPFMRFGFGNNADDIYYMEMGEAIFGVSYPHYFSPESLLNPFLSIDIGIGLQSLIIKEKGKVGKDEYSNSFGFPLSISGGVEWEIIPKSLYIKSNIGYRFNLLGGNMTIGKGEEVVGEKLENLKNDISGLYFSLSIGWL